MGSVQLFLAVMENALVDGLKHTYTSNTHLNYSLLHELIHGG